ncbi:hypothetical protein A0H81_07272 [Grifola frondosa]|uniref:Uncharacterized protein n=1 Tax=Grifola frondosa TaxID=5627 RepID=A0A1C7MEK4_GRIFR|nr:hypothetical protein A0H81_07272 [Grifola frondosa]
MAGVYASPISIKVHACSIHRYAAADYFFPGISTVSVACYTLYKISTRRCGIDIQAPISFRMTSTSPPSGAPLNIALLAGPQVLGFFLNWALQGVLTVQVYIYYLCFPNDPWYSKSFVFGLLAYEWVQTGLVTSAAFDVYVYGFGSIEALITFHNTWFSVPIMNYNCARSHAGLRRYCWRYQAPLTSFIADQSSTTPAIATWLGGSALVDVVIAVSMTILLLRAKTGLKQSDDMINRLVRLVVESGI